MSTLPDASDAVARGLLHIAASQDLNLCTGACRHGSAVRRYSALPVADRVFYHLLALLPAVLAVGGIIFARQALTASERRRFTWTGVSSVLLFGAAAVLWSVRRRIRGWDGFDNRTFDLAFVGGLAALVGLAACVGAIAVLGRSSKGVPLCPRCWYDMTAHEGLCPECGTTVRHDRELVRRKRSVRLASVAVALQLLAQFLYQYHRADHGGAQGLVPTTVLIAGAFTMPREMIISAPGFRDLTLAGRVTDNKLAEWQRAWLFSRAQAALIAGESAESVRRATTLLSRGSFESELSLQAWKRAFGMLLADGGLSESATAQLARSYLASRSDAESSEYLQAPRNRAVAAKELEEFVPALERELASAVPGSNEWDLLLRLLAAAGRPDVAASGVVDAVAYQRTQATVAAGAVALSALGRDSPVAASALLDLADSVRGEERFFAMVWACRIGPDSPWLHQAFRVLAASGEPNLEVLGAAGLASSPTTRCEGTDMLIDKMRLWRPTSPVFLTTLQWPVLVAPSDRHASHLLDEVKLYATQGPDAVRVEAVNLLTQIADQVPSRRDEIRLFLVGLMNAGDRLLAERARVAVEGLMEKRREPPLLKIAER